MKNIALTLLTLLFSGAMVAQPMVTVHIPRPMQNINLNYLGDASVLSLNYERIFPIKKHLSITAKRVSDMMRNLNCAFGAIAPHRRNTLHCRTMLLAFLGKRSIS
jgi:hypothetical protein